jgi:hypothetical protein
MAKKTFKQKRRIVKRKKSVLPKLLIGAGVIGGGYLLYTKVLKPFLTSTKDKTDQISGAIDGVNTAINTVVSSASATTPNVPSASSGNTLSPLGTAFDKLKLDVPITYGSKGEEVKRMQTVLNGVRNLYVKAGYVAPWEKVALDGVFGSDTWKVHQLISYNAQSLKTWLDFFTKMDKSITF